MRKRLTRFGRRHGGTGLLTDMHLGIVVRSRVRKPLPRRQRQNPRRPPRTSPECGGDHGARRTTRNATRWVTWSITLRTSSPP